MTRGRVAAIHQATRDIRHDRSYGLERGTEEEHEFPTSGASQHGDPIGIDARMARQPGERPLEVFEVL
jgi:hypothetical protein